MATYIPDDPLSRFAGTAKTAGSILATSYADRRKLAVADLLTVADLHGVHARGARPGQGRPLQRKDQRRLPPVNQTYLLKEFTIVNINYTL